MIAMTEEEIQALNVKYEIERIKRPYDDTGTITYEVANDANLEMIRHDDQSGWLFRNAEGRFCYGWESGGFDDQCGEKESQ